MSDREIIEALAEKLMAWKPQYDVDSIVLWESDDLVISGDWNPLADPAACALVLDEIEQRGWTWEASYKLDPYYEESPFAFLIWIGNDTIRPASGYAEANNRYRAVCLAALRAVEVEV